MSIADKAKNAAEKLVGQAKEGAGSATGNEELRAEGRADQTSAEAKKTVEDVKDVFKG
ncbi:CsbD family protein [Kineococcus rubinsiae]|uniref:CsbD family protein n=1 Tax=Kineococcus rubinsiae TaxID=2609562 RepID=UPI0014309E97|nr:CsbD family protein [Kineococcus rubinsiae]NIZ92905.1 CsbD family protein [Kineococcus rubinsiae]